MTKQWQMRQLNAAKAEILIYEDISDGMFGGLSAKMFVEQLNALGDVEELDVRINSWGGVASEGIAMFNALDRHPATVNVYIDGMAASAATLPAMAASPGRLTIAPNARLAIHEAWNGVVGSKRDFRAAADILEQLDKQLAVMYSKRTGDRPAAMLKLMEATTYLTGDEAVKQGFADEVANEPSAQNYPQLGPELAAWLKPPADVLAAGCGMKRPEAAALGPDNLAAAIAVRMRLLELDLANAEAC